MERFLRPLRRLLLTRRRRGIQQKSKRPGRPRPLTLYCLFSRSIMLDQLARWGLHKYAEITRRRSAHSRSTAKIVDLRRATRLSPAKKRAIGSACPEIDGTSCVSNDFRRKLTRSQCFPRSFPKDHAKCTVSRLLSEKTICNGSLRVIFLQSKRAMLHCKSALLHFSWFFGNSHAQCSIANCFLGKHARNAPFLMVFPESTRAIDHCRWFFRKADEKWSIARDFFRKRARNRSLRVIFSERTREMEHCAFALQDSRNKRKLLNAFTLFQTANYASARKAAGTRMPPAPL